MKKLLLVTMLELLLLTFPVLTIAEVNVSINFSLPPPIAFDAPPEVIVIPGTYAYVVPDVDVDVFFYDGWWWRPWEEKWYRSRNYRSGWKHYRKIPSFYGKIPSGWRNDYKKHRWQGNQWKAQRIHHQQVEQNWRHWEKSKHWEKQNTWGVHAVQHPQPQSRPQHQEVRPQSREIQRKHAQPKNREAPQQSKTNHGKHKQGKNGDKHGKK